MHAVERRLKEARWAALVALVTALALGVTVASAATIYYYKRPGRMCNRCLGIGQLHRNWANWMHVTDCGGWHDDNCSQEVWQQDRDGTKQWHVYHAGRGWAGRDYRRRGGIPVCKSITDFAQDAYASCYQGYGY